MDIIIKKKHPIIRYKTYIIGGCAVLGLLIYVLVASSGPSRLRYEAEKLQIAEVQHGKFLEYLDVEGTVLPIITVKLNALENGSVTRIVANNGEMLKLGDTIMVLHNPELMRTIEDERDNLEKQRITYKQKEIEMQQKSSELHRRSIETAYTLRKVTKKYELDKSENNMGILSKAQLELSEDEYLYSSKNTQILIEELRHDSLMNVIQSDLMDNDMRRQEKSFERIRERLDGLIVRAPIAGQLSFISVIQGERVSAGNNLGELKVIDRFKISTKISEYYIDRITPGLPATVIYQGQRFPLKITKVNPEIKDRQFDVDLVFTGDLPESIRIGKNYRIQVELGQPEDALTLDKGNFFQSTGGRWIFRLNETGDKAVKADITIGRQNPQQYEVLEGLRAGDRVIISGYDSFGEAQEIVLKR
ncbi:MAG: HlyD family efflux transporter periplasmic adaptor subunit [Bacteroidales bacterium]|jgi:multidrug efflux pump subunit AcrA (membrane-fusion protein)|nr:HlyD family efflux transporter periplasmic adaptor subunit [Bacteroidales bacterium]